MNRNIKILLVILLVLVLTTGGVKVARVIQAKNAEDRIKQLRPEVQQALRSTLAELATMGIKIHVGQTLRDDNIQAALVASGKSATVRSWHLLGRAIDMYPYASDGKPDMQGKNIELFRTIHKIAAKYGFKNLAFNADGSRRYITTNKGKVWDGGHIEFRGQYLSFDDAAKVELKGRVA